MRLRFALAWLVLLALLFAWPGVAAQQLLLASQQTSASPTAATPLPGLFSPARGNLMFWKTHKVGGTTLRHVLLRRQAALNLTLGVLGCTRQREPSQAHLSASHVVCQQRTRDVALGALLGKNFSEAVFVRDPVDRALSGYYFITMSQRRTDAVNAVGCGFNLSFAGRHFDGERMSDRLAFATHGYAALANCARSFAGGAAAHVRVFQPQWSYWASTPASSAAHAMHRHSAGRFFVGRTERFDESLVLLAYWLGVHPAQDMWYTSRKRVYGTGHPGRSDWTAAEIEALQAAVGVTGDGHWHKTMSGLYDRQLEAARGRDVAGDVEELLQANTRILRPDEAEAERQLKHQHRAASRPCEVVL